MGQVIPLPPPADRGRPADFEPAACVLLIALRWWLADHCGSVR
jgi:hypothetical protein